MIRELSAEMDRMKEYAEDEDEGIELSMSADRRDVCREKGHDWGDVETRTHQTTVSTWEIKERRCKRCGAAQEISRIKIAGLEIDPWR